MDALAWWDASLAATAPAVAVSEIELAGLLRAFEEYALAFDTFSKGGASSSFPRRRSRTCKRAEARPHAEPRATRDREPDATLPTDTTFLWDLIVLVSAANQQEIELTRSGSLPKRAAQRLLPFLTGQRARNSEDEALEYVELLRQEATDLGLVAASGNTRRGALGSSQGRSSTPGRGTIW